MRMGSDRLKEISFGGALFVSVLWHLFWFSSITIVSFPAKVNYPHFSDISFLGTLLDKPNFEVHITPKPFLRVQSVIPQGSVSGFPFQELPEETPDLLKMTRPYDGTRWNIPSELLGLQKKNPAALLKTEEHVKNDFSSLKGAASSRILYYQPPLPELPKWINPRDVQSSLELRFWVSPRGKVVNIEKVTSSGDPTLDLIWIRYLRRWQFNPKATNEEEMGMVTLNFPFSRGELRR